MWHNEPNIGVINGVQTAEIVINAVHTNQVMFTMHMLHEFAQCLCLIRDSEFSAYQLVDQL